MLECADSQGGKRSGDCTGRGHQHQTLQGGRLASQVGTGKDGGSLQCSPPLCARHRILRERRRYTRRPAAWAHAASVARPVRPPPPTPRGRTENPAIPNHCDSRMAGLNLDYLIAGG
jgi:hypothetical protein